jgi:hypothetical protein
LHFCANIYQEYKLLIVTHVIACNWLGRTSNFLATSTYPSAKNLYWLGFILGSEISLLKSLYATLIACVSIVTALGDEGFLIFK